MSTSICNLYADGGIFVLYEIYFVYSYTVFCNMTQRQ